MANTKRLLDIIGEDLPFQTKGDKKFADLHKVDKVRGLSEPTDQDDVFTGNNVGRASAPGKSASGVDPMAKTAAQIPVAEGVMDVYSSGGGLPSPDDEDAQRNQMIRQNMDAAQQYKQQMNGHKQLSNNHQQVASDMNQDPKLRNLHRTAADLHNQLTSAYQKMAKYHDTQMQGAVNGGGQ